jgi:hypothetical protein
MVTCFGLIRVLHVEGLIESRPYNHLRRRIDQIVSGLEQLGEATTEQWPTLELAPLDGESSDSNAAGEGSSLQLLLVRVAETVRSINTDWRPKVEEQRASEAQTAA